MNNRARSSLVMNILLYTLLIINLFLAVNLMKAGAGYPAGMTVFHIFISVLLAAVSLAHGWRRRRVLKVFGRIPLSNRVSAIMIIFTGLMLVLAVISGIFSIGRESALPSHTLSGLLALLGMLVHALKRLRQIVPGMKKTAKTR